MKGSGGDGSLVYPSRAGRAEIFSEAAGVCFRGELAQDEQRRPIRASLVGRALGPFSYQLGRALDQDPT